MTIGSLLKPGRRLQYCFETRFKDHDVTRAAFSRRLLKAVLYGTTRRNDFLMSHEKMNTGDDF